MEQLNRQAGNSETECVIIADSDLLSGVRSRIIGVLAGIPSLRPLRRTRHWQYSKRQKWRSMPSICDPSSSDNR